MEKSFCSQSLPNIMSLINELMLYTRKLCFPIGRFVSMSSIYELKTNIFLIRMQLMKLYKEQPELTSQFDVSKVKNNLQVTGSFGPVCQLWSIKLKCMRDSKQQHKLLKVTRNTTNRDKHINEASKQAFANNLFKLSCKYTRDMLFKWKICFNVFNIRT